MRTTACCLGAALLTALFAPGAFAAAANKQARVAPAAPAPTVQAAIDGVLDLFKTKPIVALADVHGLAQEDDFYSAIVRDPRFAEQVGNVVVEFGGAIAQGTIDRYVAGEDVPFTELRRVWTDVVGWFPGETQRLGFVNFYANVRAANLRETPEHRIKVWLGDPKIDWSQVHSFGDVGPLLGQRDEKLFAILSDILNRHQKVLLIVGFGHLLAADGPARLGARIISAYAGSLAIVAPFGGYAEAACTARVLARAKSWRTPSLAYPIPGSWLKSQLQLPKCHALLPADQADALLYLGPPDRFTQSPLEPSVYLDSEYLKELSRRSQCCTPSRQPLNWQALLWQNPAAARKFEP